MIGSIRVGRFCACFCRSFFVVWQVLCLAYAVEAVCVFRPGYIVRLCCCWCCAYCMCSSYSTILRLDAIFVLFGSDWRLRLHMIGYAFVDTGGSCCFDVLSAAL